MLTHKGRSADSGHYVSWVKQVCVRVCVCLRPRPGQYVPTHMCVCVCVSPCPRLGSMRLDTCVLGYLARPDWLAELVRSSADCVEALQVQVLARQWLRQGAPPCNALLCPAAPAGGWPVDPV